MSHQEARTYDQVPEEFKEQARNTLPIWARKKKHRERLASLQGTVVNLPHFVSTKQLSSILGVPAYQVAQHLITLGVAPKNANEYLAPEVADIIVEIYNRIPNRENIKGQYDIFPRPPPLPGDTYPKKSPTVVILGHVNHGKTTLIDTFRASSKKLVDDEAGGITQKVSAFEVNIDDRHAITILDTPGHAAFDGMRERGANIADIAILVVDADKGVQSQTEKSIEYLLKYKIPTIVALNKIDKKGARPNTVRKQLIEKGLHLESEGGDVPLIPISALYGTGIRELKEMLSFFTEVYNFQADRNGPAEVVVIETKVDKVKGLICSGIVRCGTFKAGQSFVVGTLYGKVRWLYSNTGKPIKEATPGMPIEFTGFHDKDKLPSPGDCAIVVDNDKKVSEIISFRQKKAIYAGITETNKMLTQKAEDDKQEEAEARLFAIENGLDEEEYLQALREEKLAQKAKVVSLFLKADSSGSIEAITEQIESFPKQDVNVIIVRTGIGAITEQDVKIANERGLERLIVLGFNVSVTDSIRVLAGRLGIIVQSFDVIYDMISWLKIYCSKFLDPLTISKTIATLIIKEIFMISVRSSQVKIAGCLVKSGMVERGSDIEIRREGETIFTGKIRQLRHLKQDVKSVSSGKECGVMFSDDFNDFEEGDVVHCMEYTQKQRQFETEL